MLLSTRDQKLLYKIILAACIKKMKIKFIEVRKIIFFKNFNLPKLNFLYFVTKIIITGELFSKNRYKINFRGVNIGRYALSATYRNPASYVSKIKFYYLFFKNLIFTGRLLRAAEKYAEYKITSIYIDHCFNINGVLFEFFGMKKFLIFTNNYPKSIIGVNFRKYKKKLGIENYIKLKKKKLNFTQKKKSEKALDELVKNPKKIPWMFKTKFNKISKNEKYENIDYIVYTHSFLDAQLIFGNDGFENTFDWLDTTLKYLKYQNKKTIIKCHPNFYNKAFKKISAEDKKIFEIIYNKYKKTNNFIFIKESVLNIDLLNRINNKNFIAISHHGSVILELAYLNIKTICSIANFFNEDFKISNTWNDPKKYINLLNKNWNDLEFPNKEDVLSLGYQLLLSDHNFYGKKSFHAIFAKILNKKISDLRSKGGIFAPHTFSGNDKKNDMKFNSLISKKNQVKISNELANNIDIC